MKKRIVLVTLLLLCGAVAGVMAQTAPKFAHIDSQALITSMPKHDSVMKQLKAFEQDLYDQMEQLQV